VQALKWGRDRSSQLIACSGVSADPMGDGCWVVRCHGGLALPDCMRTLSMPRGLTTLAGATFGEAMYARRPGSADRCRERDYGSRRG